ncbi:hypothetical protein F66182_2570 [Fusarium sp. NRRL 66182]|nr:hypothetical protein F66182_2570 [Fusarium sp. NRRL 66182]
MEKNKDKAIRASKDQKATTKKWTLKASIEALNFGALYELMDPNAKQDVAAVLGHYKVAELGLVYNYSSDGKGSGFKVSGKMILDKVALSMAYTYDQSGWSVAAWLTAEELKDKNLLLGDVIDNLAGNDGDDAEELPDFIRNLPIVKGSGDKIIDVTCLKMSKKSDKPAAADEEKKDSYILFQATVSLGSFRINFVHHRDLSQDPKDPPKRVFRIAMGELPKLKMDTLGELPQPFDEIVYLWVQDSKGQKQPGKEAGLTEAEVKRINTGIKRGDDESSTEWLFYRDTRKPEGRKPTDVVLLTGSHFIIIAKNANEKLAILDYTVGRKKKPAPETLTTSSLSVTAASGDGEKKSGKGKSLMASCKKVAGAITISNIGLRYENNVLSVLLDATFVLGPIGFRFIEAAIGIDLSNKTLHDLTLDNVRFGLSGLAVAFDQPPIRIGGIFVHKKQDSMEYYAGGIVISLEPYQFVAGGLYGKVKLSKDGEPYDTAFVFAKLNGPLITLEFAEISGITGGFGYNSEIKVPTVETVRDFPFLQQDGVGDNLLDYLSKLVSVDGTGSFTVRRGSMWLAAGLRVSAVQMLDVDAVFVVAWNPSVTLGIFGVGVADIPKTKGSRTFAHVELGILAVVDFGAGVFRAEMQLAPSSYIFDPSCSLTGGFALYYWFNDRVPERSGEWVFTIGGYHRSFKRPDYYPNPPRLGIRWKVGSNISIVGEAYLAITPKCCMGGGRLQATLTAGPLRAWFSAWADFLINFMPFDFQGQVGVNVGVSCKVDLLITSFTVSAEVGAQLDLLGPPLRGRVKVDFWVVSFTVNFGPDAQRGAPPTLLQFYEMVLVSGKPEAIASSFISAAHASAPKAGNETPHVFTCRGGLIQDDGKESGVSAEKTAWNVKGDEFVVGIDVRFSLSYAKVSRPKEFGENPDVPEWEDKGDYSLYAKPMQISNTISSTLTVDISPVKSKSTLSLEEDNLMDENWQVTPIVKEVPSALWGEYKKSENPRETGRNDIDTLLDGKKGTLPRMMGLSIKPPKPKLADDEIGTFDAIKAMQMAVFNEKDTPEFHGFKPADSGFYPSSEDERYRKVKEIWKGTPIDPRAEILSVLNKGLGWATRLTASTPNRLVENLGSMLMAAPQISVN